jgi:hypothetical protein
MNRGRLKIVGSCFILLGLSLVLTSSSVLTGSAVLEKLWWESHSFIGITFFLAGLILFFISYGFESPLEKIAREKSGFKNGKDLKQLIKKAGYELRSGGKHFKVYSGGKPVLGKTGHPVTVPYHNKIDKHAGEKILENILGYKGKK